MRRAARTVVVGLAALALLAGCSGTAAPRPTPTPTFSAPAVTSVHVESDVVYRTVGGQRLALEACLPRPVRRAPVLVLVHGGGFTNGRRGDLDFVCRATAEAGFATFSVDYRLLPARYPAQVDDVAAAIDWLTATAQADRFSLETDRVALLGASAGATIAAELATRTPGTPALSTRLRAVVLLSGFYDVDGPLGAEAADARTYLGCTTAASCTADGRRISPTDHVSHDAPPMLLVGSTHELAPLPQLQGFAAALQAAGVPHQTLVEPGEAHAEAVFVAHPTSADTVLAFLRAHTG